MIRLYSTHCPKCKVLEKKLQSKNIEFEIKDTKEDIDYLISKGYRSAPILEVDEVFYKFEDANKFVNALIKETSNE